MSTQSEAAPLRSRHRLGICLAAGYIVLAVAVYMLIASRPPDDGLEWLPFFWLGMPWSRLSQGFLIPGILVNAVLLYFCGFLIQFAWRARSR
jgi:hypothetical protein